MSLTHQLYLWSTHTCICWISLAAAAATLLTVWPFQLEVLKLWPALSGCVQPSSVHLTALAQLLKDQPLSSVLCLYSPSSNFSIALPVSAPLCLPIYQRELLSWLLGAGVEGRWKRCLIARKNLQLCFILYRTGCCSCRCRSASTAASHQIFSPPHKKTCLTCTPKTSAQTTRNDKARHIWDWFMGLLPDIPSGRAPLWIGQSFWKDLGGNLWCGASPGLGK